MKKSVSKLIISVILSLVIFASPIGVGLSNRAFAVELQYNDGKRHEVCTVFSKDANDYYSDEYGFDNLKKLSGSSSKDSLETMNCELYETLYTLMSSTQTVFPRYDGYNANSLATYWQYTDASEGAEGYYFFYTDIKNNTVETTMNREHVWAKSKASFYQKNGGADLHHLRPTVKSINSSRSNYTFGNVLGILDTYSTATFDNKDVLWFSKNDDLLEVKNEIKGDVARILLYVYVRWQQPNLFDDVAEENLPALDSDDSQNTGETVIESLDTLLEWMEIDPVDTWEMRRNDLAEDVQGNRNVFIDYPELAWLLFDEEIPSDMVTPSGYAASTGDSDTDCSHKFSTSNKEPTCETDGYIKYTCDLCGYSYMDRIQATGHIFVCVDETRDIYECEVCKFRKIIKYAKLTSTISDGDLVVIRCDESNKVIGSNSVNNQWLEGLITENITDDELQIPDTAALLTVKENDDGTYSFIHRGKYLTCPETGNGLSLEKEKSEYSLWKLQPAYDKWYYIISKNARHNSKEQYVECYNDFTSYSRQSNDLLFLMSFYKVEDINCDKNSHDYFYVSNNDGTHNVYCSLCDYQENNVDCSYEDSICIYCGDKEPVSSDTDTSDSISDTETQTDSPLHSDSDSVTDSENLTDTDSDSPESVIGDVNGDGKISMLDVTILQRAIAKLITLNEAEIKNADVDFDTKLAMNDVVLIQKYLAKLITSFK